VEIVNPRDAARKLDEDEKITIRIVDGNRAVKPNGIRMTAVGIADVSSNGIETATLRNTEGSANGIGMSGISQTRRVAFITQAGLYSLILPAGPPGAKAFKRWVSYEVLPGIRNPHSLRL
jgi:hypothetical protein